MQAAIGTMVRIAGHTARMRITIAGMRIRISQHRQLQIQVYKPDLSFVDRVNSWLDLSDLVNCGVGKTQNGGCGLLVPMENAAFVKTS